ncbi:S-layer homology domain-containing protein [Paenibacillus piri]|nr:S-layer homology domain-containing protein [Paenibacillus piri]
MNARIPKPMHIAISLAILLYVIFSYFPNFVFAQDPACTSNFTTKPMVAGGGDHTVALKSDGTVWAWGNNYSGKLGDGSNINRASPVQVSGLCGVVAITAGWWHNAALKNDGTVWIWGNNQYGQLGNGTNTASFVPVQVNALSEVAAIAAGSFHTVALKNDGTVWTWGNNYSGELGYKTNPANGTVGYNPKPLQVSGLIDVKAIAAGFGVGDTSGYTAALKNDGTVWTWGSNRYAQLGYGTNRYNNTPNYTPEQVPDVSGVDSIALGAIHAVVLKNDGAVWAWGSNGSGQLGDGTTTSGLSPVKVLISLNPKQELSGVVSIAATGEHTMALLNDGTVRTWGKNDDGQLGDRTSQGRSLAMKPDLNGNFVSIGSGWNHSMAVKEDGSVWMWGNNYYRQLGYDTSTPQDPNYNAPSSIPYPVGGFSVTATNPTLALIGKQRLFYPEWSTDPAHLTAYLNNPGEGLANITFKIIPSPGLSLVDGDAVHVIDTIAAGTTAATTWRVKPVAEGTHQATVNAYRDGEASPFATASYQFEALPPVVPPNVNLGGISGYQRDGTPVASRSAQLMFNMNVFIPCQNVRLIATDAAGHKYVVQNQFTSAASFSPSQVGLTASPITVEIVADCLDPIQFNIELIDPSGIVYNVARGDEKVWPLPGAKVVLQYYDPALSKWVDMSDEDYPGRLEPITNPQITGEDGRYAWDTAAGQYRVTVSRPGFQSAVSRVVDVPPPVTDLHVGLTPTDKVPPSLSVSGATYGAAYTQPVTIQFSASDDESGVRSITYQVDHGDLQQASGSSGSFLVSAPGPHTVDFTVADHAGNVFAQTIMFTIAEPSTEHANYTVTFNSNGGSPVSSQTVSKGSTAAKPADPTKSGFSFAGWFIDSGLTAAFDFTTVIAGDTALYAKWTASSYAADLSALLLSDGMLSPAFASGTTSYSASVANGVPSLTVTASVYNATYASVTASVYNVSGVLAGGPFTLTSGAASPSLPLSVGSNTIKVAVTAQDGASKVYTVTVTRAAASSRGGSGSSGGGTGNVSNGTTPFRIIVDGKEVEQIATAAVSEEGDRTIFTVTIDTAQLSELLAKAGDRPMIVIPVSASADKVTVILAGDAVKALENKQATLDIRTTNGSYKLPAAEIRIDSFSKQLGEYLKLSDIIVGIDIAKSDSAKVKLMENAAEKGRFTIVARPVDFTVAASYSGKTVYADKFNSYVKREIPLPDGADPSKMTTAVVLEAEGITRHAPTYVTLRDGKYYAVIHSLTNSTYSLIWHPMTFADVEGHWAKLAVNDMASRMVVNGVDENRYQPDGDITRAEFAAIIVRALGLADSGKTAGFTDVKSSDWYVGAVAKAQEYGIIEGYEDQTFRPMKTISRQEAMVMIAQAMKLAGLETNISSSSTDAILSKFTDSSAVHAWAKQAAAAVVSIGLVNGSDAGLLPASNITRAETAAIVQRLLEKAFTIGE